MPKFMRPTLLGKLHGAVLQRIASEPACRSVPTVLKKPSAKSQNLRSLRMPIGEKKIELNCFFRTHLPDKIAVVDWAVEVGCFSGKESPMYS